MSSEFGAEVQQMLTAAKHVDRINQQVTSMLGRLRGEVESTGATLQGAFGNTFRTTMVNYDTNSRNLNQALAGISEQLQASAAGYSTSDEEASASMQSSGSGLNM